jgi:hypothetical protein
MAVLKGLHAGARGRLTEGFRSKDGGALDAADLVTELDLGRKVDLSPLRAVVGEAMKRFEFEPSKSDPWLGPRIHAALRLTRREAADKRIWAYLTVLEFPHYVRWRWSKEGQDAPVPFERFVGHESAKSLAKLWWVAELGRNGSDYRPAVAALKIPGFYWWQKMNFIHHKVGAIAAIRFLSEFGTTGATTAQVLELVKKLNFALRTVSVDSIALSPPTDADAVREWIGEQIDETTIIRDELPRGPDEAAVKEADIVAVRAFLDALAERINLTEAKGKKREHPKNSETGAAEVRGGTSEVVVASTPLGARWTEVGDAHGELGAMISAAAPLKDQTGTSRRFERGMIISHPSKGSFVLTTPVASVWLTSGAEGGSLGYPTRDEASLGGDVSRGRFAYFEGGLVVAWEASARSQNRAPILLEQTDIVFQHWQKLGGEQGWLGWPIAAGRAMTDNRGRLLACERGTVVCHPIKGPFALGIEVFQAWLASEGFEGTLGAPVADEGPRPGGVAGSTIARFERGQITFEPGVGVRVEAL